MQFYRLSDEILDELLDSAVSELDEFCEQYVHDMFASEFAIPDTNTWFVFTIYRFNEYNISRYLILIRVSQTMSEYAAISSVDGCIRTYSKTSSDIEEIITKCIGIAEDLSELDDQEREIASLRDSLLSIVRSDIQLNQMSKATEQCKTAMRSFYRSSNTGEETVPDLAKLYDDELQKIVEQSNEPRLTSSIKRFW